LSDADEARLQAGVALFGLPKAEVVRLTGEVRWGRVKAEPLSEFTQAVDHSAAPPLDVVIAQDLRLEVGGNGTIASSSTAQKACAHERRTAPSAPVAAPRWLKWK
jgi:hypothetical protein